MLIMIAKMLLLPVMFINKTHLISKLLKEVLTVEVLIICKKLLNIMDKTVIYQHRECVLSNVLSILLKKITQKNFKLLFELNKEDLT